MSFPRYMPEEAALHSPRIAVLDERNESSAAKVIEDRRLRFSPGKL